MRQLHRAPSRAAGHLPLLLLAIMGVTIGLASSAQAFEERLTTSTGRSLLAATCSLVVKTPAAPAYVKRLIAEPFRATKFVISYTCTDGSKYTIKVESGQGQVAYGPEAFLTYKKLGLARIRVFACPLAKSNPGGKHWCGVKPALVGKVGVTVVYVRREIRSMSAADRQDYFDAVKTMAALTGAQGRKKYGAGFFNYYEMVSRHAAFLYTQPCDLAHLGPAFMPVHRSFTNEFNRVIQLIKPHIAHPYWDYLSDGDLPDATKSAIWTKEYYGSVAGDKADEYILKDGQFAYWRVPRGKEAKKYSSLTWGALGPANTLNPWGYFRGKANNNRAKFVTRLGPSEWTGRLPKTSDWVDCRNITVFGEFARCLDYTIHGNSHAWVAGMSGVPEFEDNKANLNCTALDAINPYVCRGAYYPFVFTGMYSRGMLDVEGCMVCNKSCTLKQTREECGCTCKQEFPRCDPSEEVKRIFNKAYYGAIAAAPIPAFVFENAASFSRFGTCGSPISGDYSDTGTSALDPIFWVHHTNIDRLLVSWRHMHPNLDFEKFGFTAPSTDPSKYPDFLSATNILNPGTLHPSVHPPGDNVSSGICYGHGLYDPLCMGAFTNSFRSVPKDKPMTNLDVLRTVDVQLKTPERENYIYDTLMA